MTDTNNTAERERLADKLEDLVSNFTKQSYRDTLTQAAALLRGQPEPEPVDEATRVTLGAFNIWHEAPEFTVDDYDGSAFANVRKFIAAELSEAEARGREDGPRSGKPFCSTCGKDVSEVLCPTCAKWWDDNVPKEPSREAVPSEVLEAAKHWHGYGESIGVMRDYILQQAKDAK